MKSNIVLIYNEKTDLLQVYIRKEHIGFFTSVGCDNILAFYPRKQDIITGDDLIAIGELLNKLPNKLNDLIIFVNNYNYNNRVINNAI